MTCLAHSAVAARLLRERDLRHRYLPSAFTGGAAWSILLDLCRDEPRQISSVLYGTGEAYTTALRHLSELEGAGLVVRHPRPGYQRPGIRLSAWAREQVTGYLAAIVDRNPQGGDVQQAPSPDESGGARSAIAQRDAA